MHQVYADLVANSISLAADETAFKDTADAYGTWQVQKAYFHSYEQNQIVLNLDEPKDCFDGLSAFQVIQKFGFPAHKSQQGFGFKAWLNGSNGEITKATQIERHNPAKYGLYFTNVGNDSGINDMFENIKFHKEETEKNDEAAENVESTDSTESILSDKNEIKPKNTNAFAIIVFSVLGLLCAMVIAVILYNVIYRWNKKRHHK